MGNEKMLMISEENFKRQITSAMEPNSIFEYLQKKAGEYFKKNPEDMAQIVLGISMTGLLLSDLITERLFPKDPVNDKTI